MTTPDLNLLITLDVLLAEASVARAAQRLHLSPSAMSRALARLRETTGDPLLVRAGRGLVPTPRALELRDQVSRLVDESKAVLRPAAGLELSRLARSFTLRSSDGFVENFGPALVAMVERDAPGALLRFVQKPNKDSQFLRDGSVDLETGVIEDDTGPELRSQALFRDHYVGVVRKEHRLAQGPVTLDHYLAGQHVLVSRRAQEVGLIDEALRPGNHTRQIRAVVGGFSAALALARGSDLIASVPERHTGTLRAGLHSFALPFVSPRITIALLWHPRLDADAAHRWLRACVHQVCAA